MSNNVREQILNEVGTSSNTRTVTVATTVGKNYKITFSGGTWGELKRELSKESISLSNMKAVESTRKATLEHDEAVIPGEDFILFLMPYKSKSGATAKKAAPKKAVKKAAPKKAAKKVATKKAAPKKTAAKKTTTKAPAKKVAAKKTIPAKKKEAISKVVESVKSKVHITPEEENRIISNQMDSLRRGFPDVRG